LADETNVAAGATLACLEDWREVTYKVLPPGDILGFRDTLAAVPGAFNPLVAGVVNIQVQYGISATSASPSVIAWVDPVGIYATPAVATRKLIKAVRIAVVARDAKLDINDVTSECDQVHNAGLCAWADIPGSPAPLIDLATGNADWKRYRYRVFETTIPLRNTIWNAN
jgi:type IV pilus assembly protein PilW